jgi:hypothetical protein
MDETNAFRQTEAELGGAQTVRAGQATSEP